MEKEEQKIEMFNGYLAADAKINYFESGKCKTTFAIPLKIKEDTVWLNCECWGRIAEKNADLKKGDEVLIFGIVKEVDYQSKEGITKTKFVCTVKGVI